jgi:hypothetical protein
VNGGNAIGVARSRVVDLASLESASQN